MTTRVTLRDNYIREMLVGEAQWPDATLNHWIEEAIRDYSVHFSRRLTATITAVADQREYPLAAYTGIQAVISVEWPNGQDPPEYLTRRNERDPRGFWGGAYYDVRGEDIPTTLVIGEKPALTEDIDIVYLADQEVPDDDADVLTVPDRHLGALVLFCKWRAVQEFATAEARSPRATGPSLDALSIGAVRAEREYRARIQDFLQASGGRSAWVAWDMLD